MAGLSLGTRRTFRFPRFATVMMVLGFVGTMFAIEMGKTIAGGAPADATSFNPVWRGLLALVSVPVIVVAIGYVISIVQQRSWRRD
jgi:hypothetical protein